MPSSESIYAAQQDVKERAIKKMMERGHLRISAVVIVGYMTYEEQCELIGQKTGEPYSPY